MKTLNNGDIVELTPEEAQDYSKQKYVLKWIDKEMHNKGFPKLRKYYVIGRWEKH